MEKIRALISKIIRNRWIQHLLFWGISYYVLLHVFASSSEILKIDLIYTAIFLITIAGGVYLNLLLLIPFFLSRRKYILYAILLLFCLFASAGLNMLTFTYLVDYLLPGYYFISYYQFWDILKFLIVFLGVTTLLKLSKGWFLLMETQNYLTKIQKENAETELKTLKAQINPHFLFNCLNSIYSLVLNHSPVAPEVILKLSAFLRYIIYEAAAEYVELSKELNAMKDYVELQILRAGKQATIKFLTEGETDNLRIAPLLFLPLIENSFKHGIKGETGDSFAHIRFSVHEKTVICRIDNNKGSAEQIESGDHHGIGLENLKRRLEMIYPDHHTITINDQGNEYHVTLTIQLNHETPLSDHRG
jgi:two-component system, LytTR family, sensor kinase